MKILIYKCIAILLYSLVIFYFIYASDLYCKYKKLVMLLASYIFYFIKHLNNWNIHCRHVLLYVPTYPHIWLV